MLCICQDQAQLSHVTQSLAASREGGLELDAEAFQRLVLTARSVAVSRPTNLVKFADAEQQSEQSMYSM